MVTGFRKVLELGVQIVVKVDGDGQMDPNQIPALAVRPGCPLCFFSRVNFSPLPNAILLCIIEFSRSFH